MGLRHGGQSGINLCGARCSPGHGTNHNGRAKSFAIKLSGKVNPVKVAFGKGAMDEVQPIHTIRNIGFGERRKRQINMGVFACGGGYLIGHAMSFRYGLYGVLAHGEKAHQLGSCAALLRRLFR